MRALTIVLLAHGRSTIPVEYSVSLLLLINNCNNIGIVVTFGMSAQFKRIPFLNGALPQPLYLVVWAAETLVTVHDIFVCTID